MKKIKRKNNIISFVLNFLAFLSFIIVVRKKFTSKGIGPLSWQEIYDNLLFYVLWSLLFAVGRLVYSYYFTGQEDEK
jgi:hypothetical protein